MSLLNHRLKVTDFKEHSEKNLIDFEIIICKVNLGVLGFLQVLGNGKNFVTF
jgi:hypothetical protein